MRRGVVLTALVALLAGCGGGGGDRELRILAYPGYAEDGSTDPSVDWVRPFERVTGCDARVRTVRSATELLTVVTTRSYDVASVSGDVSLALVGGREVVPLDLSRIPNYARVYPALRELAAFQDRGLVYGVPHSRTAHLLLWRSDLVDEPELLDLAVAGRVAAYDTAMQLAEVAIRLGYQSPYELDGKQFTAVLRLAGRERSLVGTYWQDEVKALADFTGGEAVAGLVRPRLAALLRADGVPVATRPAGTTARADAWMIPSRARNLDCAYRWLDWIVSPEPNAQAASFLGEAPATPRACAYMDCEAVRAADEAFWSQLAFWTTPRHDCKDERGSVCVDWFDWSKAWGVVRR